jgi:lipopolysaccharide transport system ATP-binding protein
MTRREIDSKLDEIIDFSGVEKFIDTPVKFYSSGMKVRLGFSVAAHLEPEILIIDEVLAVGDAEFQKKCLGKMDEVSRVGGRTILFVSHNLKSLSDLCTSGALIEGGRLMFNSDIGTCIKLYNNNVVNKELYRLDDSDLIDKIYPIITFVKIENKNEENGKYDINVEYKSNFKINNPIIGIVITDEFGNPVCGFNNRFYDNNKLRSSFQDSVLINVNGLHLHTGQYFVSVYLGDTVKDYCSLKDIISFNVVNKNVIFLQVPPVRVIGGMYIKNISWKNK